MILIKIFMILMMMISSSYSFHNNNPISFKRKQQTQQRPSSSLSFIPNNNHNKAATSIRRPTSLNAIGVLAKKAKLISLRQDMINQQQKGNTNLLLNEYITKIKQYDPNTKEKSNKINRLHESLMKRKGTITVIAEYKRILSIPIMNDDGTSTLSYQNTIISNVYNTPNIVSNMLREYGTNGISVIADEYMGNCTYIDIYDFVQEQTNAALDNQNIIVSSIPIINYDLIIDSYQIAQTASYGATSCIIPYHYDTPILSNDEILSLLHAANACNIDVIISVSTLQQAQYIVDTYYPKFVSTLLIIPTSYESRDIPQQSIMPSSDNNNPICFIYKLGPTIDDNIDKYNIIEDSWLIRDTKLYSSVYVPAEYLFKTVGGNSGSNTGSTGQQTKLLADQSIEYPGSIISTIKKKSSTKYSSTKIQTSRGEGAKEYLGDIMM